MDILPGSPDRLYFTRQSRIRLLLIWIKIIGLIFIIKSDKLDLISFHQIVVDHTQPPTLPFASPLVPPTKLTNSSRPRNDFARLWILRQIALQKSIALVLQVRWKEAGKEGRFDEFHSTKHTLLAYINKERKGTISKISKRQDCNDETTMRLAPKDLCTRTIKFYAHRTRKVLKYQVFRNGAERRKLYIVQIHLHLAKFFRANQGNHAGHGRARRLEAD